VIRHLTSSDVELLLRPLPCVRPEITMLLTYLVKSWLDTDTLDQSGAVRICLLLHRCPSYIDPDLLRCCADEFHRHGLPLCCLACALMTDPDPVRMKIIRAAVDSFTPGSVDPEIAEMESIRRVLPSTRQILALLNSRSSYH